MQHQESILSFVYWLGLLLLMFVSGAEAKQLFAPEERCEVAWLAIVGTGVPFILCLLLGHWGICPGSPDSNSNRISRTIILAIALAVTSIPVIFEDFRRPENT